VNTSCLHLAPRRRCREGLTAEEQLEERREGCLETAPAWTHCPSTMVASPVRLGRSCCWRRAPTAATCCGTARASRESTASACCECGRPRAAAVAFDGEQGSRAGSGVPGRAGQTVVDFQPSHPEYGVFPHSDDKICPNITICGHV